MVNIPADTIWLKNEKKRFEWEVEVNSFCISNIPVTQELYNSVFQNFEITPDSKDFPMTNISWLEATQFCNALSIKMNLEQCYTHCEDYEKIKCNWNANGFRLPSEAEWEYACKAETYGQQYADIDNIAWYSKNSDNKIHKVGLKQPNNFGLYDMIGNVWEWCWDLFDTEVYGQYRVFRGGGWSDNTRSCRASCRRKSHPTLSIDDLGLRIARTL